MKPKYWKKKLAAGMILCFVLSAGIISGCQAEKTGNNDTDTEAQTSTKVSQTENEKEIRGFNGMENSQITEEELAEYEEADAIEIEELELITSWETKAEITLGEEISIDGTGAVEENNEIRITEGGSYVLTGTLSDGMVYVETDEAVKLVLHGVAIQNSNGPAIYVRNAKTCYIETAEGTENILADSSEYNGMTADERDAAEDLEESNTESELGKAAIFSKDQLVLLGEGTLEVTGNYKHAICSKDDIYVESGNYKLTAVTDGIHTNDWICIDGGTIEIASEDDGMQSEGPCLINGGTIEITASTEGKGITVYGDLTVNDGTISISQCFEGLESKNDIIINGGTIEITGNDDGLNARTSITINDGTLYANMSAGDALDSNGTMEINGGLVLAFGAQEPEGGADCDMNEIVINGGTFIATGGTNSAPSESESTQISLLLGSRKAGDMVGIKDGDGNTVFAFEVTKQYSNMLLSISSLDKDKEYTVYTGGTITGDSYYGYYENGIYEGGTSSLSFTTDTMVVSAGGSSNSMGGGMKGGMGGKGQREMPTDGEFPADGEFPTDREMPDGEFPTDGEMPDGEFPTDGEMPDGEFPKDGEFPTDGERMELPDGTAPEMPNGEMPGMQENGEAELPDRE